MNPDVVVGSVSLIPSSLPRICPDVPIGGVFLFLHPHPVVCPLSFCPGSESFMDSSPDSAFIREFCDDDGWSDYDTHAVAKPMSASQTLASELKHLPSAPLSRSGMVVPGHKLISSVAGAFAESQGASPWGPQHSEVKLPNDESCPIDHVTSSCHATCRQTKSQVVRIMYLGG